MGKKQKIKLKYDNINNYPKSKLTFGVCVCVCVCLGGGGGGVIFNTHIWMLLFWVVCGFYKECVLCLVTKKEEENKLEIEN